jgi:hypothetical protein
VRHFDAALHREESNRDDGTPRSTPRAATRYLRAHGRRSRCASQAPQALEGRAGPPWASVALPIAVSPFPAANSFHRLTTRRHTTIPSAPRRFLSDIAAYDAPVWQTDVHKRIRIKFQRHGRIEASMRVQRELDSIHLTEFVDRRTIYAVSKRGVMTTRAITGEKAASACGAMRASQVLLSVALISCSSSGSGDGGGSNSAMNPGGGGLQITTPVDDTIKLADDSDLKYQLTATGGVSPYAWSYNLQSADRLPAQTSLSSDGVLSGTPCHAFDHNEFSLIFTVTDKDGLEASISMSLSIVCCSTDPGSGGSGESGC